MPTLSRKKIWLVASLWLWPLLTWPQASPRLSQVQVARQFLLAVLGGNWEGAYQFLSPETRQQLPMPAFRTATQPIIDQARIYGPTVDLYKLGYRLREDDTVQPFVAFTYRADSLGPGPHLQLDVTFQDSAARQILQFSIIPLRAVK